jgi:hypothetical protein
MLWHKTNPRAAVLTMFLAPFFAFGIEAFYNSVLSEYQFLQNYFGVQLNFLHRVFLTILFCVITLISLTKLWSKDNTPQGNFITPQITSDILYYILIFVSLQFAFVVLISMSVLTIYQTAFLASFCTFALFVYRVLTDKTLKINIFKDDRLYAGLLTATTVFLLYYFA